MNQKSVITIAADDGIIAGVIEKAMPNARICAISADTEADIIIAESVTQRAIPAHIPVIWLGTSRPDARELWVALEKPVRIYDLLAAIRLLLARAEKLRHREVMLAPHIQFLPVEKLVRDIRKKQSVGLTEKETDILYALRHGALTREALLEKVWGYGEQITTHTLETHMYRLRTKLKPLLGDKNGIATTESGYAIDL